jgi:hypothetical protein
VNNRSRTKLVELLELAHGFAVAGSAMPFRSACVELVARGTEVARIAGELVDKACVELKLPEKPQRECYRDAIGLALERVQEGVWP